MKKKMIALMLIFAMLVSLSPAVAADENVSQPTIEEILNGYHEKAFAAHITEENGGASTYSRSAGSEKTLEEETVDELTAAGYEAYHVTGDNYEELADSLNIDFSGFGLDSGNSYIVVISGEDNSDTSPTPNSRVIDPPNYDYDIGVGSSDYFYYTYEGETYQMRYVTITPATTSGLVIISEYDLSYTPNVGDFFLDTVGIAVLMGVDSVCPFPISTVGSLISSFYNNILAGPYTIVDPDAYTMNATSSWTRQFIQVWDDEYEAWFDAQSSAYAVSAIWLSRHCYDPEISATIEVKSEDTFITTYSPLYSNTTQRKIDAINAYLSGTRMYDLTGDIDFYYLDGNTLVNGNGQSEPLFTHAEQILYLSR